MRPESYHVPGRELRGVFEIHLHQRRHQPAHVMEGFQALFHLPEVFGTAGISRDMPRREHPARHHIERKVFQGVDESQAAAHGNDPAHLVGQASLRFVKRDGPVHHGLHLGGHAVEIYRRAEDDAVGGQELFI